MKGFTAYAETMTLRDWFAGQALAGILATTTTDQESVEPKYIPWTSKDVASAAEHAYALADAMLAEREKKMVTPGEGDDAACESCLGYGYFDDAGNATVDKRGRKCTDCTGTGIATPKAQP